MEKWSDILFGVALFATLVLSVAGLVVLYLHLVPVLINP